VTRHYIVRLTVESHPDWMADRPSDASLGGPVRHAGVVLTDCPGHGLVAALIGRA
jgi:hypothetical protein